MKKEYINPTMEIVKMETTQMIAALSRGFGDPVDSAAGAESRELDDILDF